jgi:CRP-like cAMP-binding protein
MDGIGARDEMHALRDVLLTDGETPQFIFFPHVGAVASIIRTTTTGQMVEAGVVGGEGLLSVQAVLAQPEPTGNRAVVQNEGTFTRIAVADVRVLFNAHAAFRAAVLAYTSMFVDQVSQNVLCNRLHAIDERLAKWLLVMRDRVVRDELHLTHEFLSYMLGVHRPGVSLAIGAFVEHGLIRHQRNRIELKDPAEIAARSCECYRPLHEKLRAFAGNLA